MLRLGWRAVSKVMLVLYFLNKYLLPNPCCGTLPLVCEIRETTGNMGSLFK